ncbi:YkgJ family cysteine cluster protein [Helicobacter sp.]|uniref:YkgJ family cysteine cluster protein n=1 Tax=Helicobacter sp. TaxID=218 RepID=UPI0025BCD600|nr:YkgJ family cysteine cluster protein [Helicobacter sp.]MBR2495195.1 YkgJ family cysteine cluster protein [Helicobacter sp.]
MTTKAGFDFGFDGSACKSCGGRCCVGESGYIFLTLKEVESIAAFLGVEFEKFVLHYVKKVGYRFSLIEKSYEDGFACVFFDTQKKQCGIYETRPAQCRTFPFWEGFQSKSELTELCALCPGVVKQTQG